MDINSLRELIRTGEFLGKNPGNFGDFSVRGHGTPTPPLADTAIRDKWIFDVKFFVDTIDLRKRLHIVTPLSDMSSYRRNGYDAVMGALRSLYNNDTTTKRLIASASQQVFIVHGHDNGLIEEVKQTIAELDLSPVVLREEPDQGRTIIEKLESYLGNCKCAVVLYTPCDEGKAVGEVDLKPRARQNVVYEHGLFQGYLGRMRVILLKKGATQPPGDYDGVIYTSVDNSDWKEKLKAEISAIDQ